MLKVPYEPKLIVSYFLRLILAKSNMVLNSEDNTGD
jgi:hypothetical protein